MKTIILWDPRFPDRAGVNVTVDDALASAAVRAGVAAAANPSEHAALAAGGTLDAGSLQEVLVQVGLRGADRRLVLPLAVAQVGVTAGVAAIARAIVGGTPTPTPGPTPTPSPSARMLIVAGQSNALLLGATQANAVSNGVANDDAYTFIINPDNSWSPYKAGTKAGGFKEDNSTNDPQWGPEAQFIKQWRAANPTTPLYVVKVARGGTPLAQSGSAVDWSPSSSGELYSRLVSALTAANSYFAANSITCTPLAMLWTQWEADAIASADANAYGTNLANFIAAMRANGLGSTAPFIFARGHPISDDAAFAYVPEVQAGQQTVAMNDTKALQVYQNDIDNGTLTHPGPLGAGIQVGDRYYKALVGTLAPTIFLPSTASVQEGQAFSTPLSATVPNPTYALSGADASKFAISVGNLTMAAKSYASPSDANGNGVYDVVVSATNPLTGAVGTASLSVTVTAASAGDAFVSRLTGSYTTAQTNAIKALIARMQTPVNGAPSYWDSRDSVVIPYGLKGSDRLLDWKQIASATLNGTATTDANGFVGPGGVANYVSLPFDLSTSANLTLANGAWSASMMIELTSEDRSATFYVVGNSNSSTMLRLVTTTTNVLIAFISGSAVELTTGTSIGRWVFTRVSNTVTAALNGGARASIPHNQLASKPGSAAVAQLFRERTTLAGKGNVGYAVLGSALTADQEADWDTAIQAYKAAMA